jgi:hypothetical protein
MRMHPGALSSYAHQTPCNLSPTHPPKPLNPARIRDQTDQILHMLGTPFPCDAASRIREVAYASLVRNNVAPS